MRNDGEPLSLLDELADEPRQMRLVDRILQDMTPEDRDDLLKALAMPHVSSRKIARLLTQRGHRVSPSSIQDYRNEIIWATS